MTPSDAAGRASSLVEEAARQVVAGRLTEAAACLREIDRPALWKGRERRRSETKPARDRVPKSTVSSSKRGSIPAAAIRDVFVRDGYVCQYCSRRAIELDALKALSTLFPVSLPTHPNWKKSECHPIYWTHVASLEHLVPVTHGGTDDGDNLICACYECNDARSNALLADLGWEPRVRPHDGWDGLLALTRSLAEIAAELGAQEP